VQALVNAPGLVTGLWSVSLCAILLVCAAVIDPSPLETSLRNALELGVMLTAVLLISPLSEPQYHVFLVVPFVATLIYVWRSWPRRGLVGLVVGIAILWLLEIQPGMVANRLFANAGPMSSISGNILLTLLPATAIAVATFGVQVCALMNLSTASLRGVLAKFVIGLPGATLAWANDLVSVSRW
jgi:hypothetical protein